MRNLAVLLLLAGAPLLFAQQAPAPPAGPLLSIEVLGPAAWRERFLPTNFGSMLASVEGAKLWGPLVAHLDGAWSELDGEAFAAARQRVLAFAGPTQMLVWAEPASRPGEHRFSGMLSVAPAGRQALDLLAADVARWFSALHGAGPASKQTVGGEEFEVCRWDGGTATVPVQRDRRIIAFLGDGEQELASAVARGKAWLAAGHPPAPKPVPLRVELDLAQAVRLLADDDDKRAVLEALGLHSLGTLAFTLTAEGPSVLGELSLTFGAGERGLFAGLFPAHAGVPRLYGLVPPDATAWKVGRCDGAAIWRAALRAVAAGSQRTEQQVVADVQGSCGGVDVGTDLLSRLTDEALLLWQPRRPDQGGSRGALAFCVAVPVVDVAAFKTPFVKILKEGARLEVAEEHGEVRAAAKEDWLLPPYEFGLGNGIAVFAVGRNGGELMDAVLRQAAARPVDPMPAPPRLAKLARAAPDGWNGAGVIDIDTLLHSQLGIFLDLVDELTHVVPIEGEYAARMLEPLRPLLQKHELTHVVTLSGSTKDRWRFRMLW